MKERLYDYMESFKKYLTELIGTCFLVFFGCGTACLVGTDSGTGYILTALVFGLVLAVSCASIGRVSGGHFNPAVTLSMLLMRRIGFMDCLGYMAAQYIGGIGGSALLYLIFSVGGMEDKTGNLGANLVGGAGNIGIALLIETLLSLAFILTVIGVSSSSVHHPISGIVCGLALMLVHVFGIGFTGTSVNPARSLAPALFARGDALRDLWIFFAAPVIGAILAALLWIFFGKGRRAEE